jgi:transglutaminase-like putative cysteine protease
MHRSTRSAGVVSLGLCFVLASASYGVEQQTEHAAEPRARQFRLDYGATLKGLPQGARVHVWLPVPPSNDHQEIEPLELDLPAQSQTATEPTYGNRILYFETKGPSSGSLTLNTSYRVRRREVHGLSAEGVQTRLTDEQRNRFLAANRKVPLEGKQLALLKGIQFSDDPLVLARSLYERVDDHVRYDKSRPGYGNGDVRWVCDSRFGNCTDFHSLFISLARGRGLPARFEIGFPLPPERGAGKIGGYHCWALFYAGQNGWVPVDISEADKHPEMKAYYFGNLTENRVTFTTGRDIQLVPKQDGEPLNFFVYPYVEVDGKVWPPDKMQNRFAFRDF